MALSFDLNNTPATAAEAVYLLKELLKAAGWTVPRSSDGTTYNSSGDQISSGGSGANGMNNNRAWFVVQEPASPNRQYCFQRTSSVGANTSYQWRVKYSKGAGFSGGSPGATQVPSATDEQTLLGSGTDSSPTFAALFATSTDGGFRWNGVADSSSPYGWASFAWVNTTGLPTHTMIHDPITSPTTADVDTVVIYCCGVIATSATGGAGTGSGAGQWESFCRDTYTKLMGYQAGTWSTAMLGCILCIKESTNANFTFPAGMNVDEDSKDNAMNIPYIKWNPTPNLADWKGFSTMVLWVGTVRTTGTTLSIASTKDRVVLCDISLPWDGSTVPQV